MILPYKDRNDRLAYNKGYYAGYRRATIEHLGNKCVICNTSSRLEIHHIEKLNRQPRSEQDLKDLSKLELRCKKHHKDRYR